jgi:hypothetical protein
LSRPFAYLRDPLFLVCLTVYFGHRAFAAPDYSTPWLQAYLNDVICIPFWVPMILWGQRVLRLRSHDGLPTPIDLVVPLVVWSLAFEVILPTLEGWRTIAFPDPGDIVSYAAGGLGAAIFWRWWYRSLNCSLVTRLAAATAPAPRLSPEP